MKATEGLLWRFWSSPDAEKTRFLVVGAWNTAVGYLAFVMVHLMFGEMLGPSLTLVLAYCLALPHSFVTQRVFAFQARGPWRSQLARFALANSIIFAANLVFLPVAVSASGADPLVMQAVFVAVSTVLSFLAHKFFSFSR